VTPPRWVWIPEAVNHVLTPRGLDINRLRGVINLSIGSMSPRSGRRVSTLLQGGRRVIVAEQLACIRSIITSVCLCSVRQLSQSLSPPTAPASQAVAALDNGEAGELTRPSWDAERGLLFSGDRRGRSQRGCEHAGVWEEAARPRGPEQAQCVHTAVRRGRQASPAGARGLGEDHESLLV